MAPAPPISEEELAVRGYEFSVAFEEGGWQATAWQLVEIDLESGAPTLQERLTTTGVTPLAAFITLYAAITGKAGIDATPTG
ncbi:MAG: hypothetical protein M3R02_20490 [Chloroflexota bacterium]|nr:hypothetical protein [Chloroflexota bacterium]